MRTPAIRCSSTPGADAVAQQAVGPDASGGGDAIGQRCQVGLLDLPHASWSFGALENARGGGGSQVRSGRRDVCLHTRFVPVTAVINTDRGATITSDISPALMGAGKALWRSHRSPVFMDEAGAEGELPYELVVLPEMPTCPARTWLSPAELRGRRRTPAHLRRHDPVSRISRRCSACGW